MLPPRLRNRVFELWTDFWASGMSNPLVAIEQITYLLFLKQLEVLDATRKDSIYRDEKEQTCRWSYIVRDPSYEHITQTVFPWLREIDYILNPTSDEVTAEADTPPQRYMSDASFQFDRNKEAMLKRAIKAIDSLFDMAGGANADLMGDIFEYLLNEIQSSGKNGQFRTPRHIIRLMIDLVDPQKGEKVLDPAAGTAGFLINSALHLKQKATAVETVRLEWDGSPHRLWRDNDVEPPFLDEYLTGSHFTGFDNDRTMVRIAWMNMVLHGIENPLIIRGDSLGKRFQGKADFYDVVLANPPFTGTVDIEDLEDNGKRFPRPMGKDKGVITNKSELLFVWLILDMLRIGGRAAVIVPEGVLFGSTNAHKELRKQLLLQNEVDGIISLPAGVFQPYTGVKTSIVLFHKRGELPTNRSPRTQQVWFYEVEADGRTMDAKRDEKPEPNDIWDVIHKYHVLDKAVDNVDYYQPHLYPERWRVVDDDFFKIFPELDVTLGRTERGKSQSIGERFKDEVQKNGAPTDPRGFTEYIIDTYAPEIYPIYRDAVASVYSQARAAAIGKEDAKAQHKAIRDEFTKQLRAIDRIFSDVRKNLLDQRKKDEREGDTFGDDAIKPCVDAAKSEVQSLIKEWTDGVFASLSDEAAALPDTLITARAWTEAEWQGQAEDVVRKFAMLDGYDVLLRDPGPPTKQEEPEDEEQKRPKAQKESKSWAAPVRVWARNDDWTNEDETIKGSHDSKGNLRPEYVKVHVQEDGSVDPTLLEPDCIEANDYNLSAGRYKPFKLQSATHEKPAIIIRRLQKMEANIQAGLSRLLEMVEG